MGSYSDLLRSPLWQKKRLEIMSRDEFSCVSCGDKSKTLNVHHIHYLSGRKPWEYHNNMLQTLCVDCHKEAENNIGDLLIEQMFISGMSASDIHGIACDFYAKNQIRGG